MFGFLKKSLKQAVDKVAKAFQKEEAKETVTGKPAEERKTEEIKTIETPEKPQEVPEEKEPLEEKHIVSIEEITAPQEEKPPYETKEEIVPELKKAEEPASLRKVEENYTEKDKKEGIQEEPETRNSNIKSIGKNPEDEGRTKLTHFVRHAGRFPAPAEPEKKPGLLRGLLEKVTKKVTEKTLSAGDVDKFISELQTALLENDVALETAEQICNEVKEQLVGKSVRRADVETAIKDALKRAMLDAMKQEKVDMEGIAKSNSLTTVIFFGFNGAGKTTTIAKLAHKFRNCKPVVAAGDTFRAASIEQLEEHSEKVGFDLVKHNYGADSAAVIFDAKKHAAATGSRLVLADTAGRSHSNANLMDELKKVVRVNKPELKVLVLDSVTGNDIYDQSKLFNDAVGVDAIILTKADVYEKGGAALSAAHTIGKPILYLGTGQGYDDLEEFDAEKIVKSLVD